MQLRQNQLQQRLTSICIEEEKMRTYNSDELYQLSGKELHDIFFSVRSAINKAKKESRDVLDLEVYFCYLFREIEQREKRAVRTAQRN